MKFTLQQITELLGGKLEGDSSEVVDNVGKIEEAGKGQLSFLSNPKYEPYIYTTNASAVIVNNDFEPTKEINTNLIRVEDAYSSLSVILQEVERLKDLSKVGVEPMSFCDDSSTVGEKLYRGAFSYIGKNCTIGKNVKIYPHVYIGDNVTVGDNTIFHSGSKVYNDCEIGSHCTIHANAVIGSDGFGFAPQSDGSYKSIPQLGNVVIENHVVVGANTVIDCATMGSTRIKEGVKLDNLIQVAHNVEIGEHTVVAAQAGFSGSSKIGKYCQVGGQAGIGGHIKLGDKTIFGAQAGTIKNIAGDETVLGSPAINVKDYYRAYAIFRNLPDLRNRIEDLEEKVLNLPSL